MIKTVLFIGSDPNYNNKDGRTTIDVPQERKVLDAVYSGREYFGIVSYEHCSWNDLADTIVGANPSIVHICAHGASFAGKTVLRLHDDTHGGAEASAETLRRIFERCPRLELVYLDACRSAEIARILTKEKETPYFCIGFAGDVPVDASTRGSGVFHSGIASGRSVLDATRDAADYISGVPQWNNVVPELFYHDSLPPRSIRTSVNINAKFFKDDPTEDDHGFYAINFGLDLNDLAAPYDPNDQYLVCFFADEREYIDQEYVTLLRGAPNEKRMMWHPQPSKECWDYNTNSWAYCTYVHLKSGYRETVKTKVAEALTNHYNRPEFKMHNKSAIDQAIGDIVSRPGAY